VYFGEKIRGVADKAAKATASASQAASAAEKETGELEELKAKFDDLHETQC
jgi:hypothetical protein